MPNIDLSGLETLSVSIENHIAHIQLCRPKALNSMVPAFWRELPAVVRQIDAESQARVIVISSQGKHLVPEWICLFSLIWQKTIKVSQRAARNELAD